MGSTLPTFTPLEDSLWLTLCCRALDNRRPQPILGDAMADQVVHTLDYDYRQFHISTNLIVNVATRAKKLDEVAAGLMGFLTPGRAGVAAEPAHQPLPQRGDGLQQPQQVRRLGDPALPRDQGGGRARNRRSSVSVTTTGAAAIEPRQLSTGVPAVARSPAETVR
jgi:hypothetical protein